jgi:hydroxymethylpyrimidine/phosphomethylpyrimidine kinase
VVAEVPGKVSAIAPVPPEVVAEQIRLSFEAYPVAAVKTGLLHSQACIEAICDTLASLENRPPLVVDPVMIATSGAPLLEQDAVDAYRNRLFPMATLVTPNLDEVRALLGWPVSSVEEMRQAGRELCRRFGSSFLLKGGHLRGEAIDTLVTQDGDVAEFTAPRVVGVATHGTGCTFSAAIAAGLASGLGLQETIAHGKQFVTRAIAAHFRWPRTASETHALNHSVRL